MTMFYARPYDISATGFYFEDVETYQAKIGSNCNDDGQLVEEFEIQFIDGEAVDCALCKAFAINQCNVQRFIEIVDEWEDHEKLRFIIAVGECGYDFDIAANDPNNIDIDIYGEENLRNLAVRFVEDGLFGEVPEHFRSYIDYDAIARDLAFDYTETEIGGERLIYRCG